MKLRKKKKHNKNQYEQDLIHGTCIMYSIYVENRSLLVVYYPLSSIKSSTCPLSQCCLHHYPPPHQQVSPSLLPECHSPSPVPMNSKFQGKELHAYSRCIRKKKLG